MTHAPFAVVSHGIRTTKWPKRAHFVEILMDGAQVLSSNISFLTLPFSSLFLLVMRWYLSRPAFWPVARWSLQCFNFSEEQRCHFCREATCDSILLTWSAHLLLTSLFNFPFPPFFLFLNAQFAQWFLKYLWELQWGNVHGGTTSSSPSSHSSSRFRLTGGPRWDFVQKYGHWMKLGEFDTIEIYWVIENNWQTDPDDPFQASALYLENEVPREWRTVLVAGSLEHWRKETRGKMRTAITFTASLSLFRTKQWRSGEVPDASRRCLFCLMFDSPDC